MCIVIITKFLALHNRLIIFTFATHFERVKELIEAPHHAHEEETNKAEHLATRAENPTSVKKVIFHEKA